MRKICTLTFLASVSLCHVFAQRQCGIDMQYQYFASYNTGFAQHMADQKASLHAQAADYLLQQANLGEKTTGMAPVPVVFHMVIDSTQYNTLGGMAGIMQRADSQIAVLNRDYNRMNSDSTLIPSGWKSLYANVGISFGLARIDPSGNPTTGIDLHIITAGGFNQGSTAGYYYPDRYSAAKHASSGGADAWDNTRYMNVWCINFLDYPGLLGTTIAKSWTVAGGCDTTLGECPADDDQGICITYDVLGKRASPTDVYPSTGFDLGRTMTHEVGHLFEIWHVWGDDGGLCPWSTGGGDDGIADTPPQSNSTTGNPPYTVTGGTITDGCKDSSGVNVQPIGYACLDYLDYTDDAGMLLFTPEQAAVMAAQVDRIGGENYGLVRNPSLTAAVAEINETAINVVVSPNPSTGIFNVAFPTAQQLKYVEVTNTLGQIVYSSANTTSSNGLCTFNLYGMASGIYFVKCTFAAGITTHKIRLQ